MLSNFLCLQALWNWTQGIMSRGAKSHSNTIDQSKRGLYTKRFINESKVVDCFSQVDKIIDFCWPADARRFWWLLCPKKLRFIKKNIRKCNQVVKRPLGAWSPLQIAWDGGSMKLSKPRTPWEKANQALDSLGKATRTVQKSNQLLCSSLSVNASKT